MRLVWLYVSMCVVSRDHDIPPYTITRPLGMALVKTKSPYENVILDVAFPACAPREEGLLKSGTDLGAHPNISQDLTCLKPTPPLSMQLDPLQTERQHVRPALLPPALPQLQRQLRSKDRTRHTSRPRVRPASRDRWQPLGAPVQLASAPMRPAVFCATLQGKVPCGTWEGACGARVHGPRVCVDLLGGGVYSGAVRPSETLKNIRIARDDENL